MNRKTHRILSMILVIALVIGMLSIGMISTGAIRVFPETSIKLNVVKAFNNVEYDDRYYLTYTPDRDITVALEAGGSFKTFVQLFDSKNEFLDYSEEGGAGYNFRLITHLYAGEAYTFIVYCEQAPTAYDADNFWVYLSEVSVPTDAKELTMEGWTNFTLTAEDNDQWYRFTADDTNEFQFEIMGFPEYWDAEQHSRYTLLTKLYDDTMTKVEYQKNNSKLGSSGQHIEESGYLLEKDKTYYLNLRAVNIADDLDEVLGKITVSFETPEDHYIFIPETKKVTINKTVRVEREFENEPYFGYYSFTPKKSGVYRLYYDHIYVDTGFGTDSYDTASTDFYNGNGRHILWCNTVTDENNAYCSAEVKMNAGETYTFMLAVNPYGFIGDYCEFCISEVCGDQTLTYLLGDADDSGEIDTVDAGVIQRALLGLQADVSDEIVSRNGDVDQNETLDIIDATLIQRYLAKFHVNYPIGEEFEA